MAVRTDIAKGQWLIGAAFTFRVLVTSDGTAGGAPTNMTGYELSFVLKPRGYPASDSLLPAKLTPVDVQLVNVNGTNDAADVRIDAADHAALDEGTYDWALWRTDGSNDRPLAYGTVFATMVPQQ